MPVEAKVKSNLFTPSPYRDGSKLGWAIFFIAINFVVNVKTGTQIDVTTASLWYQVTAFILGLFAIGATMWGCFTVGRELSKPCRSPLIDDIISQLDSHGGGEIVIQDKSKAIDLNKD